MKLHIENMIPFYLTRNVTSCSFLGFNVTYPSVRESVMDSESCNIFVLCNTKVGTIFNLVDSLSSGTVGVLVTAQSRLATLEKAQEVFKFIRRIVS